MGWLPSSRSAPAQRTPHQEWLQPFSLAEPGPPVEACGRTLAPARLPTGQHQIYMLRHHVAPQSLGQSLGTGLWGGRPETA